MRGFFRLLTFSPRLTIGLCMMLFGGIGGALSSAKSDDHKKSNPWSSASSSSGYSAQKRADDGWGSSTRGTNSRNSRNGVTYQEVWVDRDGVVHEKEDMKAIDPDAFN